MKTTTARWAIALTAATIFATQATGAAQTAPPTQPPAEAQPAQPPTAAPSSQPAEQPAAQPASPGSDVAKAHLTAARNALSQITQLPAASQLQGEARMQVSQLINNFNELITTQTDWKASYAKVEANLNALLSPQTPDPAPASATPGAVGTSGSGMEVDPSIRAKLVEFRSHLSKFKEVAASGAPAATAEPSASAATQTTPPAAQTAPPAQPTSQTPQTSQTPPANQPPTSQTNPPAAQTPPSAKPDSEPDAQADPQELLRHVEAIEVILGANATAQAAAQAAAGGAVGTTGTASGSTRTTVTSSNVTLTQAQLQELRTHLAELRRLLEKK